MLRRSITKNLDLMEAEEWETEVKVNMELIIEEVLVADKASMETNQLIIMVQDRLLTMQEKPQWPSIHQCISLILQQGI